MKQYYKKVSKYLYDIKRFHKEGGVVEVSVSYRQPNHRYEGSSVMVIGGSSGIGLAIAKAFLAEGAFVVIAGRNQGKLDAIRIKLNNPNLSTVHLDISDVNTIKNSIDEIHSKYNNINIFINSAGVSSFNGEDMMSESTYNYIVNTNQKGLFFANKAQGEYLINHKIQGRIINITSHAGERSSFDPYTLSKWGGNSITKGVARWLAPYHIAVNGIAPGMTPTNITENLQKHINSDNDYNPVPGTKRYIRVEEIAELALFLASGAAGNIIGQIVNIDGGRWD